MCCDEMTRVRRVFWRQKDNKAMQNKHALPCKERKENSTTKV